MSTELESPAIKLHNTASGRKEVFIPQNPQRVTM